MTGAFEYRRGLGSGSAARGPDAGKRNATLAGRSGVKCALLACSRRRRPRSGAAKHYGSAAWKWIGSGGPRGLQIRWDVSDASGGFDSHPLPPCFSLRFRTAPSGPVDICDSLGFRPFELAKSRRTSPAGPGTFCPSGHGAALQTNPADRTPIRQQSLPAPGRLAPRATGEHPCNSDM